MENELLEVQTGILFVIVDNDKLSDVTELPQIIYTSSVFANQQRKDGQRVLMLKDFLYIVKENSVKKAYAGQKY